MTLLKIYYTSLSRWAIRRIQHPLPPSFYPAAAREHGLDVRARIERVAVVERDVRILARLKGAYPIFHTHRVRGVDGNGAERF